MKIKNVDSRNNNACYEIIVVCKNESELETVRHNLIEADFALEYFEDLEINVFVDNGDYPTKQEFINDIRKIAKK